MYALKSIRTPRPTSPPRECQWSMGRVEVFLGWLYAVVCQPGGLVLHMDQAVPLAAELCVEFELVIQP